MSDSRHPPLSSLFPFSLKDLKTTLFILAIAVGVCILLQRLDPSAGFAMPVFVLAVLLTSLLTTGYFWGLFSAVLGVIAVNLTITGYPLSFLTFLSVSVITSALTTKTRQLDRLRMENEKIKMRADLLRSVSHDIRTPLTSIIGSTSAVLDNPELSPEDRRTLLEDVKHEAQWLIRVVENLLSITRIGSDQAPELSKQPEPAEEVLAEAAQKARKRLPQIKFSVDVPEELLMVPMDPILIEQVLSNLIENAVNHGVTTTAIHLSVQKDGDFAAFSVRDNGQGIAPALLPHLFDYSIRHTLSPIGDGKRNMGLGLSVCSAVVKAHGGTLTACNHERGAEFIFRLPISKEASL